MRLKKIAPRVLACLRMGLYQLILMDKIPAHAAVAETVALVKHYGHANDRTVAFANAVLRNAANAAQNGSLPRLNCPDKESYYALQYSHPEWKEHILPLREKHRVESGDKLTPGRSWTPSRRRCPKDTIVATDVGQHQMWSIQHFHFTYPGQLLTSGGFGTMGFGLGAAIGAKMGNPDKVVIHTTGDGCFRMNCHELATVQYYNLPIITWS